MSPQKASLDPSLILILFGIGVMVLLTIGVFIFVLYYQKRLLQQKNKHKEQEIQHQKELTQRVLKSEEDERRKIAANLHDELGALLNTAKMSISRLEKKATEENLNLILQSKELITQSIATVRTVSQDLASPVLEKFGLIHAISDLSNQINESKQINVSFYSKIEALTFDKDVEIQIFRILKELLTNIIKHAQAEFLALEVTQLDNKNIEFKINHDGIGINQEEFHSIIKSNQGLGLSNLLSRSSSIQAELHYKYTKQQDASIHLVLPYMNEFYKITT
jgi:two-component system, NarL family, sensor kinase